VAHFIAARPALAANSPLLTMDEIKKLVESGRYKDALNPIYRALALQGPSAAAYDRSELFMLRAECQLQNKDQSGLLASLEQAKKEAIASRQFAKLVAPTALAALVQQSTGYKYTPKNAKEGFSILDPAQRPAAYAALFAEDFPLVKAKVAALNNAKTMAPILEFAKRVGTLRALEIASQPDTQPKTLQVAPLISAVTTNADLLMTNALNDLAKQSAAISDLAQQIIHDTVPMYDANTRQSWFQPRTRRRGITNQEAATLRNVMSDCDKIHLSAAEIAAALASDFDTYQALATKADTTKAKSAATLNDNYSVVP